MSKDEKKSKKIEMTVSEFRQREMGPIWDIFDFSSNIPASLYSDSTGLKLPEACFRGALFSQNRLVSEEYLLNSKRNSIDLALPIGVFSYASFSVRGSLSFRHFIEEEEHEKDDDRAIKLPPYKNVNAPLGSVMRARRSIREWSGYPISLEDLSTLLFFADGVTGDFNHAPEGTEFAMTESLGSKYISKVRTAPSGGGLYPVYLYVVVQGVKDLEKGLYVYMPLTHSLRVVRIFDEEDLARLYQLSNWGQNIEREKINIMFFYVYSLYENSRKYVDMGLTFALIEAGEISQNIHLVSTALNLGPCDIGGYSKGPCEKFLGIDGITKHLIHLTILGS